MVVQLLPHQEKVVGELSNGKVLTGAVGTGKTVTALAYYYTHILGGVLNDFGSIKKPTDLYVFTTAHSRDSHNWQKWAAQLGISTKKEYSLCGIQFVVDSYNNIDKYTDIKDSFVILDEQRLVGSGAWSRAFIKIAKSNQWIMLSATPGDTWEDYIPLFVANGFYKNRTEFKRDHCVYSYFGKYPKLERYISEGKLIRLRNQILVEMPYERHTTRHIREVAVDYDRELFAKVVKKRWHVYEDRPLRDVSELFTVMRKVVNSDPERVQSVKKLMESHPRLIVFYNFDYELELLRTLMRDEEPTKIDDILKGSTSTPTQKRSSTTSSTIKPRTQRSSCHVASSVDPSSVVEMGHAPEDQPNLHIIGGDEECLKTKPSRSTPFSDSCRAESSRFFGKSSPQSSDSMGDCSRNTTTSTLTKTSGLRSHPDLPNYGSESGQKPQTQIQLQRRLLEDQQRTRLTKPGKVTTDDTYLSKTEKLSNNSECNPAEMVEDRKWTSTNSLTGSETNSGSSSLQSNGKNSTLLLIREGVNSEKILSRQQKLLNSRDIDLHSSSLMRSGKQPGGTGVNPISLESTSDSNANPVVIAEWNGHKHEPVPTSDRWVYLVQYVAGAEAWNCVTTDTVVFFSLTYSYKNFEQAQGRIDRLDTPFSDLFYYVLVSDSPIDRAVSKALKNKQSFNENKYFTNT